jgi:hypothetical protein
MFLFALTLIQYLPKIGLYLLHRTLYTLFPKESLLFPRKIIHKFEKWVAQRDRKPLILRGARQVGKITAVDIFSERFDQYKHLNLE